MKHTPRIGDADLLTNEYYNDLKWVYKESNAYSYSPSHYQCTIYCFSRCQEDVEQRIIHWGNETIDNPLFTRSGFSNAKDWYGQALWDKSVDNPKLGDIVCYGSSWGGGFGHVRIVEKIIDNYMYLSGGNESYKGGVKFNIKCPITVGGGEGANGLQGYIHPPYFKENETLDYKKLYEELKAKYDAIKEIVNE